MSDKNGFTHISVESSADDDVVISAGISSSFENEPVSNIQDNAESIIEIETDTKAVLDENESVEEFHETTDESSCTQDFKSVEEVSCDERDDFKESTSDEKIRESVENDLDIEPMTTMQKGIIVTACILVVVAIVYCIVFM